MLDLLAQGKKTVEVLADEVGIDVKLASAHLKTLREARLVKAQRDGKFMVYELTNPDVAALWVTLRQVAEAHLLELQHALGDLAANPADLTTVNRTQLLEQARTGDVIVIDVRPELEYAVAHLPFARSVPLEELELRLASLPTDKEIVAYCRGPFCVMSDAAVALLAAKGYRVRKIRDGVSEWRAAGMPIELAAA
jgi:rhodanese-related sulfurtransferase/DNA-binding transcriptional ArsR family regulator